MQQLKKQLQTLSEEEKVKLAGQAYKKFLFILEHLSAERRAVFESELEKLETKQIQEIRAQMNLPEENN